MNQAEVHEWVSDIDGAHVVQIDTTVPTGRLRVLINDGVIYDGDPVSDEPPGAHCNSRRRFTVGSADLACCDECGGCGRGQPEFAARAGLFAAP